MKDDPWAGWQAFGAAAQSYFEQLKTGSPAAANQFGDFLRDQFAQFVPWQSQGPSTAWQAPTDAPWAAFGPTREQQTRLQRQTQAWRRMEAAQRRLQRLWQDVLREASAGFMAKMGASPAPVSSPDGVRALYDGWIDCAEAAYARVAHSDAFCQAQAEWVNAGSEWRREQQADAEQWLKQLDLPTRSEVNSLTRRLQEIESQLRAQRPAAATATKPEPAAANKPKVRRRTRHKS